uniref:Nop14-like family n=1 Tax=Theileria annulata TaxID=5874 RepID=A0A3B0N8G3_THEAN
MSKNKSKKPTVGKNSVNPFEKFDSKIKNKELNFDKKNKSKFIKKVKDSDIVYDYSSKKSRKLQLYNLNEPITLTHKNRPIEENYDSDLDLSSEEEIDLKGDYTNISEAYKEFKDKREANRKVKQEQKNLLVKLDKQFEEIDFSEFYKPPKKSPEFYKTEKPKKLDEYETNLRDLQLSTNTLAPKPDLVNEFKSASNISERSEVVEKIIKSDGVFLNFAKDYITIYLQSLVDYLKRDDTTKFNYYFFNFSRAFLHLSNKSYQEYKLCLEYELAKITPEIADTYEYLLLYLIVKTVEPNSEIYKYSLTLVEACLNHLFQLLFIGTFDRRYLPSKHLFIKTRLLLSITYNFILETGYYMPFFYHVAMRLCTIPCIDRDSILLILKTVKVTLNRLLDRGCYIHPIVCLIIQPRLVEVEYNFRIVKSPEDTDSSELSEFEEFKKYINEQSNIKYLLKSLDIYNSQKLRPEFPKLKTIKTEYNKYKLDKTKPESNRKLSRGDKQEYKILKRELLTETLKKAEFDIKKRAKQRLDTEKRYKEVVRDAMIEQDMLKKLSTSGIY